MTRRLGFGCCALLVALGFAAVAAAASEPPVQGAAPSAPPQERFTVLDRAGTEAPATDFDRLRAVAEKRGTVRVIVGLRVAFTPEGALAPAGRTDQRAAIAEATAEVRRAVRGSPHELIHTYDTVPYIALELSGAALDRLEAEGVAATLQQDRADPPALTQSTPIVEAPESASVGRNGGGQVVAILDTGVSKPHPFLEHSAGVPKVLSEACYSANANCPGNTTQSTAAGSGRECTYAPAGCRHGTHVAGIAAGKGASFSGVARSARLISIKVFSRFDGPASCAGQGEDPCTLSFTSDQIKGLERVFALRNTYDIAAANMSISGGQFMNACDADSRKPVIDNLRSARIPTVIASGNDGFSNAVGAPGCISTAVTVGATNDTDQVPTFSNSSAVVDLFAPGEQIRSSIPGGEFTTFDGTSMAAPHVAGAWAIARQVAPAATVLQVQQAFEQTGKPVTDTFASPPITRDRIRAFSAAANLGHSGLRIKDVWGPADGLGLASDGVGLARRTNANPNPTTPPPNRTFNLTGIPADARIRRAYIVYQTIGGADPTFKFKGTAREAELVGGSGQFNCWGTNNGGAFRTYRYVVPAGEVTGNGTYTIGGIGGNRLDGQGASLVVVHDDPGAAEQGRAYLRWGAMTARPGGPAMSHTFTGLSVPGPVVNRRVHVGIGDGEEFNDPAMLFSGVAVTASNFWSGKEGDHWDDDALSLAAGSLPAGTTSRTNTQAATGECLTWAYAGLTYQD